MQEVVANVDHIRFVLEDDIDRQIGVSALPFTGMDKSGASVCIFFKMGRCMRGPNCPFRHIQGDRATVCKHWLRGLCKKNDQCEFLHEYDMSKMPECYFYQKFGRCDNKDCQYQHIDPGDKIKDCPWYDRGFCKHGPICKYRHRRRLMCTNYLVGFCPIGSKCRYTHPRWELPMEFLIKGPQTMSNPIKCNNCQEYGHKASECPRRDNSRSTRRHQHHHQQQQPVEPIPSPTPQQQQTNYNGNLKPLLQSNVMKLVDQIFEQRQRQQTMGLIGQVSRVEKGRPLIQPQLKDLSKITCFKCGQKGHYASRCPQLFPHLQQQQQQHEQRVTGMPSRHRNDDMNHDQQMHDDHSMVQGGEY